MSQSTAAVRFFFFQKIKSNELIQTKEYPQKRKPVTEKPMQLISSTVDKKRIKRGSQSDLEVTEKYPR